MNRKEKQKQTQEPADAGRFGLFLAGYNSGIDSYKTIQNKVKNIKTKP